MRGFLIRVGIDTTHRNIGYCAPIFSDNCFEYIPLPEFNIATSEKHTYGTLKARNPKHGEFLSDFLHEDKHEYLDRNGWPYLYSIDEEFDPLPTKDLKPHLDPEFDTCTFGDFWMASGGRRGRLPRDLREGNYIFFYSGLSRYDAEVYKSKRTWYGLRNYQIHNKCAFLIGLLKIQKIFDIKTEAEILEYGSEIRNNAHYKFYEGDRVNCITYNLPTVIVKGGNESRLLQKAILLNAWDPDLRKYRPTDLGKRIGLKPMSGTRIMKWLNDSQCKDALRVIDRDN